MPTPAELTELYEAKKEVREAVAGNGDLVSSADYLADLVEQLFFADDSGDDPPGYEHYTVSDIESDISGGADNILDNAVHPE